MYLKPKIKWSIQGAVSEAAQKRITAEARRQMRTLHRDMDFQKLQQGRRRGLAGGLIFNCTSVFGLDLVEVAMRGGIGKRPRVLAVICFCGIQIAEGWIVTVIEANEQSDNADFCIPWVIGGAHGYEEKRYLGEIEYPPYNYGGVRYLVRVCQKEEVLGYKWINLVCSPFDFDRYAEEDHVSLVYVDTFGPAIWGAPEENVWRLDEWADGGVSGTGGTGCAVELKSGLDDWGWPEEWPLIGQMVISGLIVD